MPVGYWPSKTYHYFPETYYYWHKTYYYWPVYGATPGFGWVHLDGIIFKTD